MILKYLTEEQKQRRVEICQDKGNIERKVF